MKKQAKGSADPSDYELPTEWDRLSDHRIFELSRNIRDERAGTDTARLLIEQFVAQSFSPDPVSRALVVHLRDAFNAYLNKERTLEVALGLEKRKGRPRASVETRQQMAGNVLRLYVLECQPMAEAIGRTSDHYGWEKTTVETSWRTHKHDAFATLVTTLRRERG